MTSDRRLSPRHRRAYFARSPLRGFTLIELLVVIAIISLLVAVLLPSLARAKGIAMRVQCTVNMKSQFLACTFYMQEYDEYLPGSDRWCGIAYGYTLVRHMSGMGTSTDYWGIGDTYIDSGTEGRGKGTMLDCPSANRLDIKVDGFTYGDRNSVCGHERDYNYDLKVCPPVGNNNLFDSAVRPYGLMDGSGCSPADQMMIMDTCRGWYPWGYIYEVMYWGVGDVLLPHDDGNTVTFWDGSAAYYKRSEVPTDPSDHFWNSKP